MTTRHALLLLLALAAPAAAQERPNLVLVTLDTTRADHLGAWGWPHARTPNLDALAQRGTRFERCDTAVPVTLPSHSTLLTGTLPPQHGVRDNATFVLQDDNVTVAERLAENGYDTAAVIAAVVLQRRYGTSQGFRVYDDDLGGANERNAEAVTERALEILPTLKKPFFLWVHYFDPHSPYEPPDGYRNLGGPHAAYDGEIAFMDAQVGRLLKAVGDATAIVVGDHGEMLGDFGEPEHGILLRRGARRVPLILAGRNVPRGETVACLVRTADVAPTLMDLAGLANATDRRSTFLRHLKEDALCETQTYSESFLPFYAYGWYPLRSFSDGDWLYVHGPRARLYDLNEDSDEANDVVVEHPDVAEQMRLLLDLVVDESGERLEGEAPAAAVLSADEAERLRSLGYLGGGGSGDQTLKVSLALPDPRSMVHVAADVHKAGLLLQEGRCDEALPLLVEVSRKDPRNFPAVNMAGLCLRQQGRIESALNAFQRASALNPRAVEPLNNAAGCLLQLQRFDEAETVYRSVLDRDATAPGAASNLAVLLRQKGKLSEASVVLEKAFAAGGGHAGLYVERGILHAQAGRLEEALKDFDEAGRRDPQNPSAWDNGAKAALMLQRPADAVERYERLAEVVPPNAALHARIGQIYLQLGQRTQGEAALRRALALTDDPQMKAQIQSLLNGAP